ncbi:guanylate-binding protein 5-like [Lepisosteus oculatus]|uniref:guanylate-binding protein 5-like n=1 Tax=Lepisosteus oculatus TaxID=7918 RepID=UPI0035F518CD
MMATPQIFIEIQNDKVVLNERAAEVLSGMTGVAEVIGIVGKHRTGKSYLLSRFFNEDQGFKVGHGVEGCTKGIWMWSRPHPFHTNACLLLLDTEGLDDCENRLITDKTIFLLTTLLSSSIIFNIKGCIDRSAIEEILCLLQVVHQMSFVSEEKNKSLKDYLPNLFYILIRDFQFEEFDHDKFKDKFLNALDKETKTKYKEVFDKTEIHILPQPALGKVLKKLPEMKDEDLDHDFLTSLNTFVTTVRDKQSAPKAVKSLVCTPGAFVELARSYINMLNKQDNVCLTVAALEMNEAWINKTFLLAKDNMENIVTEMEVHLPHNEDALCKDYNEKCDKVIEEFMKKLEYTSGTNQKEEKKKELQKLKDQWLNELCKKNCMKRFTNLKDKYTRGLQNHKDKEIFNETMKSIKKIREEYFMFHRSDDISKTVFSELGTLHLDPLLKDSLKKFTYYTVLLYHKKKIEIDNFVGSMKTLAEGIEKTHKGTAVGSIVGAGVGIAGSAATIGGILLAPFTAGASLALTVGGVVAGVSGGATVLTSDITKYFVTKNKTDDAKKIQEEIQKHMRELQNIIEYVGQMMKVFREDHASYIENMANNMLCQCFQAVNLLGPLDDIIAAGASVAGRVVRVAGGILAAATMIFDILIIKNKAKEFKDGSEIAKQINHLITDVEKDLNRIDEHIQKFQKLTSTICCDNFEDLA